MGEPYFHYFTLLITENNKCSITCYFTCEEAQYPYCSHFAITRLIFYLWTNGGDKCVSCNQKYKKDHFKLEGQIHCVHPLSKNLLKKLLDRIHSPLLMTHCCGNGVVYCTLFSLLKSIIFLFQGCLLHWSIIKYRSIDHYQLMR